VPRAGHEHEARLQLRPGEVEARLEAAVGVGVGVGVVVGDGVGVWAARGAVEEGAGVGGGHEARQQVLHTRGREGADEERTR